MRILTERGMEKLNREHRKLRRDLIQVNADRADLAGDLRLTRRMLDHWRGKALKAEEACRRLAAENERLRRQVPAQRTPVKEKEST